MSDVSTWNAVDDANTAAPPDGWPEFMMPSGVNNCGRMMMGAVRRMYDSLTAGSLVLPYLKLSGGSLSGGLGISGGLTASGTVQGSYLYSTGNANIAGALGTLTTNASEYWIGGAVFADRPGGTTTNLHAPNGQSGLSLTSADVNYYGAATHNFINRSNTATFASISSAGLSVTSGAGIGGPLTVAGNTNLAAVFASTLGLSGPSFYLANDTNFGMQLLPNNNRLVSFASGFYFEFDLAGPDDLHYTSPLGVHFVWREADGFAFAARNAVGGNGAYVNISDRRVKNAETITPATAGLPEILQLQPVEFQRLPSEGGPPPAWELGFVAQDVAPVLPQAVSIVAVPLPDGSGGRDSSEPTLGLTAEAIVAALVNAVKTIDHRLTQGGL